MGTLAGTVRGPTKSGQVEFRHARALGLAMSCSACHHGRWHPTELPHREVGVVLSACKQIVKRLWLFAVFH